MRETPATRKLERIARETWPAALVRRSDRDVAGRYLLSRDGGRWYLGLGWNADEALHRLDEETAER